MIKRNKWRPVSANWFLFRFISLSKISHLARSSLKRELMLPTTFPFVSAANWLIFSVIFSQKALFILNNISGKRESMRKVFRVRWQISRVGNWLSIFRVICNAHTLIYFNLWSLTEFFLKFIFSLLIAVTNSIDVSPLSVLSKFLLSINSALEWRDSLNRVRTFHRFYFGRMLKWLCEFLLLSLFTNCIIPAVLRLVKSW